MTTDNDSSRIAYAPPWKDAPDGLAANLALADIVNNLPRKLTVDGSIHAETLLAASGAIAGFTAQRSLMYKMTAEDILDPSSGFQIVETTSGGLFYFGEPLDQALLPQSPTDQHKLWPLAASGAIEAGLDPNDLPPLPPMFEYVAKTLGSNREGTTSIQGSEFQAATFALLRAVWPLAMMCFNSQLSGQGLTPPAVVHPALAAGDRCTRGQPDDPGHSLGDPAMEGAHHRDGGPRSTRPSWRRRWWKSRRRSTPETRRTLPGGSRPW